MSKKTLHKMIKDNDQDEDILECIKSTKDINKQDKKGNTPLHLAVDDDSFAGDEVIQALIDAGADVNAKNSDGDTPLILAAKFNIYQCDTLIEAGADVNAKNNKGYTAFHYAIEWRNSTVYQKLIEAGAEKPTSYPDGTSLLVTLLKSEKWDLAIERIEAGDDVSDPECVMCALKNIDVLKALIKAGADVQAKRQDRKTALHWVIWSGAYKDSGWDTIQLLLDQGVDINAKDKYGKTALLYATEDFHLFERLIRAGATGLNDIYNFAHFAEVNCTILGETICNSIDCPSEDADKLIVNLLQHGAVLVWEDNDPKKMLEKYLAKNPSVDKKLIRKLFKENHGK